MDRTPTPPTTPLAIIGAGCLFPGSADFAEFWSRVCGRFDAIREVPPSHWDAADYLDADPKAPDRVYAARGGFLDPVPFPPQAFGIPPSNLEATDASQLLGLLVAQQALDDCGYSLSEESASAGKKLVDRSKVSVILGVTGTLQLVIPLGARLGHPIWRKALAEAGVAKDVADDVVQRIADGYVPWQENSFPGLLGNVVAGRIANKFDLGGTNCVVDAACASSLSAVHLAAMELATGRADMVLTGGVDTFNDIFMFTCFSKTPALSPTGDARPFAAAADGTVLGEGLGMVVLKRLDDARRDGDRVYAVLRGVGSSSDGKGGAIYAPRKEGQVEALTNAYRAAGVSPDTIELVEAHGTGTKVGDAIEVSALAEVYSRTSRPGPWCAVGSIKSQIGHTKAAAGVAGLLKAAAALYHKVLPPTIKVSEPLDILTQEGCPLYVNTTERPWMASADHPRRAAVSAFGFGGSNFHAVLEEADAAKPGIDWSGGVQIVAFSAGSVEELRAKLQAWPAEMKWTELRRRAAASRREWDADAEWRLLLVVSSVSDASQKRSSAETLLRSIANPQPTDGVYLGRGAPAGKLGVLFPGQGSQYVGMLREAVCHFPQAFDLFPADLAKFVYPPPAFTPEAKAAQESALRQTDVAQPALGAVSLGAWRVLEALGVQGDAFAGHSFGELTALCAAGWLADREFFALAALRGRLMAQAGSGAMLAVKAGADAVAAALAEEGIELVLANKNSPAQTVLSGPSADIDRAAESLARRKLGCVRLPVAAAFHSPLVAAAREPFAAALSDIALSPAKPVYSNSATHYPADLAQARDLLSYQLARPVEWVRQTERMHDDGVRDFVEIGPGGKLAALVEATLAGRDAFVTTLDPTAGRRSGWVDLACLVAALAARGRRVDLARWDPIDAVPPPKPGMTVELSGVNYKKPRAARPSARRESPVSHPPTRNGTHKSERPLANANPPAPAPAAEPNALSRALEMTRESLASLQQMQEQTAKLHRQFLDGQEQAHRTVHLLVEQQQRLMQASLGGPVLPMPAPPRAREPEALATVTSPSLTLPALVPLAPRVATPAPPAASAVPNILLEVISEKTGYPAESLGLGMSLDADLGIDSIKRVEILSALQERLPDAPQVKPEHLGTLHTLADIAAFLGDSAPAQTQQEPEALATEVESVANASGSRGLTRGVVRAVPLSSDARRAIVLPAGSHLWLSDDGSPWTSAVADLLSERGFLPRLVRLDSLPAGDSPAALLLIAPQGDISDTWLGHALMAAKRCANRLRRGGLLATISRLDGAFGFWGAPRREPLDGGLSGLAKTAGREWPDAHAKAIDVSPDATPEGVVEELLLAGPAEVGLSPRGKVTLTYKDEPAAPPTHTPLQPGELVVVTGGARGVTAEVAVALAKAFRPTLLLLGRSPAPEPEPAGLARFADEASLRRELGRRTPGQTPRSIGERVQSVLAAREIRRALDRAQEAGGKAIYQSVDIRNADAVRRAIDGAKRTHGPVRAVVHGAGVLADARIEDKSAAQFDDVYQTKVAGLRHVLDASGDGLRALALFSSSTARFGRAGQADYAIANEVLNKLAWAESARRPGCRVVSFNWGPWDGGMVHAGLKKLFAEEGVGVIPLEAGASLLVEELRAGPDGPRELVVLAESSGAPKSRLPEPPPLAFERVLDSADYPVLASHVLDGRPVLPAALMLEWLAHAAMVQNPGLAFHGCDDLRVLHGVALAGAPLTVRVGAAKATRRDGLFVAAAEMRSSGPDGRETLHARAEIVLANVLPPAPPAEAPLDLPAYPLSPGEVYGRSLLFHGPALQGIKSIDGCGEAGVAGVVRAAPAALEWMRQPLRKDWLSDPLVIDGAFQLGIVWTQEQRGAGSLPTRIRSYRQYRRSFPTAGARVVVAVERAADLSAVMDVDFVDPAGGLVARMTGYESVIDPNLSRAFRRNETATA